MTILHPEELRDMTVAERQAELEDIETELLNAEAVKAAGGMPENPGRIKEMRRTIARIKTIQREMGDHDADVDDSALSGIETRASSLFGPGGSDEDEERNDAAETAEDDATGEGGDVGEEA